MECPYASLSPTPPPPLSNLGHPPAHPPSRRRSLRGCQRAAEDAEERRLEAVRKEEEESRLARDAKNREREKIEKMRAEIQVQEAKAQMKALGQDVGDEIVNMKEDERQKLIQDQRDKAMQKEIDGARKSLEQARRLDYITRALRLEELPVLEARYAKHLEDDRKRHDAQYLEAVAKGKVDHAAALLEKQRLARVQTHREKWEAQVLAARKQQYVTDRADAEAKFKQDAIARKVSRARRRAEDFADEQDRKQVLTPRPTLLRILLDGVEACARGLSPFHPPAARRRGNGLRGRGQRFKSRRGGQVRGRTSRKTRHRRRGAPGGRSS